MIKYISRIIQNWIDNKTFNDPNGINVDDKHNTLFFFPVKLEI